MNATPQQPAPSWPASRPPSADEAAALARFEALTPAERQRAARLAALSGAPIALCCAAVEATRARP